MPVDLFIFYMFYFNGKTKYRTDMQISVLGESLGVKQKDFNNCYFAVLAFLYYYEFRFVLIFCHCTINWDEVLYLFLTGNQMTVLVLLYLIQSRSEKKKSSGLSLFAKTSDVDSDLELRY